MQSSKTTPLFVVDNERPRINGLSARYPQASARATDAMTAISAAAFSIDDGPWMLGGPTDEIFDDQSEFLQFTLPSGLASGSHSLSIRVMDRAGNIGSTTTSFLVK